MPPVRTQAEHDAQEHRNKLANSYQSLLSEFSSTDLHIVGNYQVGRLIGKGSFGKVYLAQHKLTNGSKVVLKSTKKEDANLAREIHHHRQFLHPHIARLYEVIVTENLVWLVLEFCPGDELYNHLLEHGRMESEKVQKIFTQLVGAVSYVHAKGCVHRDLKLENILLDKNGNVKLVDFGFTREYSGSTSYLQTWCGTVCYSAPEMIKGEKYAGEKVDVWSLGIILYALLTGELPFDEDDDDTATKAKILKEDPKYPEYIPEPAKELIKKLLSKRPLLRPTLSDILKDPWLAENAPHQQEILKIQPPPPFSTQLEKDVLQRMRSAGVDIDMVIEHVLAQRCDSLAGWWALLLEKEQRKEKRRERKRKERDAESKSIRRLSTASGRLLAQSALGEIHESEENAIHESPRTRGRRLERANGSALQAPELPKVTETKSLTPEREVSNVAASRSRSRPPPPPKDYGIGPVHPRGKRNSSRGSQSMLRTMTTNPDLLSPSYVPPPQRRRPKFYPEPLRQQLAWVKHFFKEGTIKRTKSPLDAESSKNSQHQRLASNGHAGHERGDLRELHRVSTGPAAQIRRKSVTVRPELQTRATMPARPRINTTSSTGSGASIRAAKRTSLSPGTLTPHSSYRRSSVGLKGRKSTSSSVSSIRTAYQPGHAHTHSKASSTSSNSVASPSGLSSTSGSRLARSPHSSVKVLPSTPTTSTFPSGMRISRRPPPGDIGLLPKFGAEGKSAFGALVTPSSPGLPVFARRKRSVFKGPMSASPHGRATGNSRSTSVQGRPSGEMMPGVEEEDEEEEENVDDMEYEEVDQFGPELNTAAEASSEVPLDTAPATPLSPLPGEEDAKQLGTPEPKSSPGVPLTAEALAKLSEEEDLKEAAELQAVEELEKKDLQADSGPAAS